jgi:hypothetical protein
MKKKNPMKNKVIAKKVADTQKRLFKEGKITPFMCTNKGKRIISKIAKKRANSDKNPLRIMKGKTWIDFYGEEIANLKKEKARNWLYERNFNMKKFKRYKYKNNHFKSSYELAYAKYLDKNKIKWIYEPSIFKVYIKKELVGYCPDFYLPKENKYIEIKGWWRDKAKKKFELFKKQYPHLIVELLFQKDLKKLGIL